MDSLNFGPEDLADLIGRLRLAGFKVSAGQHINAQNLLVLLASRGHLDDAPHGLGTWLAPVFCSSSEEQASFYKLFDEWSEGRRARKPRYTIRVGLFRNRWLWRSVAIAAVVVVVAAVVVHNWPTTPGPGPGNGAPTPTPNNPNITTAPLWPLAGALGLLALVFTVWWFWKSPRTSKLVKWRADDDLPLERLRVKGIGERLFDGLYALRRYRSFESDVVDVNSTVNATARNAGWFTPIYGFRKTTPEYLLMIDRAGFGDQQASLGEALCGRLQDEGVSVSRYFFQSDPRVCRGSDPAAPHLTLEELVSYYPDHELIIFGDGEGLLDPLTGRPASWLSLLSQRLTRVLITPMPQRLWGYRERALAQEGFLVVHADSSGVARLTERIIAGAHAEIERAGWQPRYPEGLKQRPERWLIDEAPPPEVLKKLRFQLRLFLGAEGYQWLCACAVYPELLWDLTLYFGRDLGQETGFEENLSKLVQLPWFRHGVMPDWLRRQLVSDLEHRRKVRQALSDLLVSYDDGVCDPIELKILPHREEPQARCARGNKILHDYVKAHPESTLRDYVLLTFMSGQEPDILAVDVPDEVLDRLRPRANSGGWIYFLDAVLLAEAFFILLITALFPTLTGLTFGLLTVTCNVIMVFWLHERDDGDIEQA